jgi:poly(3-hydroxybutyrate) depolymerase
MSNKVNWAIGAAAIAASTMALTVACSTPNAPEATDISGDMNVTQVIVNGKQVTCITWSDYKKGGLSCNWEPFNRQ